MAYSPNNFGILSSLSKATAKKGINNTGSSIPMATVVKLNSSGISLVDPSVESDVDAIAGLTSSLTIDGASTEIVGNGSIENITTSFNLGDPVYLNYDSTLTNVKPAVGVGDWAAGDFIVRVGVVAMNADVSGQKDLIINLSVVGQL